MSRPADGPIDALIVEQASEWMMLHWGGELDADQRQAFAAWQHAHPEHRRAWQRLQQLQETFGACRWTVHGRCCATGQTPSDARP